ncbi:hypothetical protein [Bacillus paranthracis]|uniref:hypothetical protein n=1 Tax=Bacillus paranthracis TaxID=2026186 RepID=UPI0002B8D495|nr:hypothetical protein [Bacillus paranthracis]MCC2439738.1 hypothetical protein [Bacillus paranthracis]MDG1604321.1 hypothetical protein [Bacillus paranthracis]RGO15534.1 hypothetical protein DXB28_23465 [Bacillus cereus]
MSLATVDVSLNQNEIRKYIYEQINQELRYALVFWDINRMSEMTCLSKSFLENEFLNDIRMKRLERRKEKGKRIWPFEESVKVIKAIMDEW